ncbi:MAG: DUF3261 domain-containing protein [Gammaproteobacteria bacterium]
MSRKWVALLTVLLVSAGCAALPPTPGCTPLGRGQFCLLPPSALPPVEASHLVSVTRDGREHVFMGLLHIDTHDLRLAAFSLFGTNVFNLDYDGQHLTTRPGNTDWHPQELVAMLELTLADPGLLQNRLHDLTLKVRETGQGQIREVFQGSRLIVRIEKSAAPLREAQVQIEIPPAKLSVRMTPLAAAASSP